MEDQNVIQNPEQITFDDLQIPGQLSIDDLLSIKENLV